MKKAFSILMTAIMILNITAGINFNVLASGEPTSGKCGDNAYWNYDETTKTLTISGSGAMYDNRLTWLEEKYNHYLIKYSSFAYENLVIEEGITKIGYEAFANSRIKEVTIPASVTGINSYAFQNCRYLENVYFLSDNCSISSAEETFCNSQTTTNVIYGMITFYCNKDSEPYKYAKEMGIDYHIPYSQCDHIAYLKSKDAQYYYCKTCGSYLFSEVPADYECREHDFVSSVITTSTCSALGVGENKCSVCGYTQEYEIPKKDHTPVTDYASSATCIENGLTQGSHCSVCGTVIVAQETIPATGHNFGTNSPNCLTCGAVNPDYIAPTEPSTTQPSATQPTTTEPSTQPTTAQPTTQPSTIPSTPATTQPSTTQPSTTSPSTIQPTTPSGSTGSTSQNTGSTSSTQPSVHEHTYAQTVVTHPACIYTGVMQHTCTTCGQSYTSEIPATGQHSFGQVVREKATCSKEGIIDNICELCGYTQSAVIPATGEHSFGANGKCLYCNVYNTVGVVTVEGVAYTLDSNKDYVSAKAKKASIKKLAKGKKQIKVAIKKASGVKGYQIQYSTSKKFTKKTTKSTTISKNSAKTPTKTIKKLKSKKTYYVRVRTYKTVKLNGKNVKVYSKWSKVKSVKTK